MTNNYGPGWPLQLVPYAADENGTNIRALELMRSYCGSAIGRIESKPWQKFVMRGGPISRTLARLLRSIAGDWPLQYLMNEDQDFPKKFKDWTKWGGGLAAAILIAICVIFAIVAVFMLPLCCCSCYRDKCWGRIFCNRCVADRGAKRIRPISAIKKRRRRRLSVTVWVVTIAGILLSLLALAFGIKFAWTPRYAMCQFGRLGTEISATRPLLNPDTSRSSWVPNVRVNWDPAGELQWLNQTTEIQLDTNPSASKLVLNLLEWPVWTVMSDLFDKAMDAFDRKLEDALRFTFIGFVVVPVVSCAGFVWALALLQRLRRYSRERREPKLKKYARIFAFLWGFFAFVGLFLLIVSVAVLLFLGVAYGPCRLFRHLTDDPEKLIQYTWLSTLYNPDDGRNPVNIFVRYAFQGWSANDTFSAAWPETASEVSDLGLGVTYVNEVVARAFSNSIASTTDGVCGGIMQDAVFVWIPLFLAGLLMMVLWPICYKTSHYFYDRERLYKRENAPPEKEKEPQSATPPTASPSTMLFEAKRGDVAQFNTLAKQVDPKVVKDPNYDNTTLHFAAFSGDVQLVRECLSRGVPVNSLNKFGYTALAVATSQGHAAVVDELIRAGADATIQDEHGETPMHVAARCGDLRTVTALCAAGVDPTIRNDEGEVAVDTAAHHNQLPVEEYLDVRTPPGTRRARRPSDLSPKAAMAAVLLNNGA